MARKHPLLLIVGLVIGLLISGRFAIRAQDRAGVPTGNAPLGPQAKSRTEPQQPAQADPVADVPKSMPVTVKEPINEVTLQDALLRPYKFSFARPTPLEQVCAHLRETLKAHVVLDLAALERQSVEPDDPVQLELDGVRLKTGLKLLLDQVRLTFHVVAEDNLMIITDQKDSEDPNERMLAELRSLHRDLHAVQDAVDDLADYLGLEGAEAGPRVRKPTIIEEMPEDAEPKPGTAPTKPGRGGEKLPLPGTGVPEQGSRPLPSRVPLASPRPRRRT